MFFNPAINFWQSFDFTENNIELALAISKYFLTC